MYKFSTSSLDKLDTCEGKLVKLMEEVIKKIDITIIYGHRNEYEQNEAFKNGNSKLQWPKSKHNSIPSKAVDVAPYPIDWYDEERFIALSKIIFDTAKELDIKVRWGGDFNMDGNKTTNDSWDKAHWELIGD